MEDHINLRCPKCTKSFAQKSSLSRHKKKCLSNIQGPSRQKACRQCAISKLRCSLEYPRCRICLTKDIDCSYNRPSTPAKKSLSVTSGSVNSSQSPGIVQGQSTFSPKSATSPISHDYSKLNFDHLPEITHDISSSGVSSRLLPTLTTVDEKSIEAVSRHSMNFLLRVFRTYITKIASGQNPPFIHWSHMQSHSHLSLSRQLVLIEDLDKRSSYCEISISCEISRILIESRKTFSGPVQNNANRTKCNDSDDDQKLAAIQAYIIYAIVLLFPRAKTGRTHSDDQHVIIGLQETTLQLAATDLTLDAETKSPPLRWDQWIVTEAKRRTILTSHMLIWAWSLMNGYQPFSCREIGFMASPSAKSLWEAKSGLEWDQCVNAWSRRWNDGPHLLIELMEIAPEDPLTGRTEMWLEETDEFGTLLMSLVNAVD